MIKMIHSKGLNLLIDLGLFLGILVVNNLDFITELFKLVSSGLGLLLVGIRFYEYFKNKQK